MNSYNLYNYVMSVRTQCYDEGDIMMLNPVYDGYLNIYTGGDTNVTGKMGVCHNGVYDSVCDANWDDVDATVFCQTFGQHSKRQN